MPKPQPKQITDVNMLKVMAYVVANKVNAVNSQADFCTAINFSPTNIPNIRRGAQSFNLGHIEQCCRRFNVNANYIFGISPKMFREEKKENPIAVIKAALHEIEQKLK